MKNQDTNPFSCCVCHFFHLSAAVLKEWRQLPHGYTGK